MSSNDNIECITVLKNFGVAAGQAIREVLKKISEERKLPDKSNNWRRLHGLPAKRRFKKHCKNH